MMLIVDEQNRAAERAAIRAMFEARKGVFIDLLGWDLPVLAGRFEVDQFDDGHAIYLILTDPDGDHLASARLLPTTRAGILSDLYPHLSDGPLPQGPEVFEITRFCLSRGIPAGQRRLARDRLVTAIARYGVDHGIKTFTGVAELGWLQQILSFGWECHPLGLPRRDGSRMLGALAIHINDQTIPRLVASGISSEQQSALAA